MHRFPKIVDEQRKIWMKVVLVEDMDVDLELKMSWVDWSLIAYQYAFNLSVTSQGNVLQTMAKMMELTSAMAS